MPPTCSTCPPRCGAQTGHGYVDTLHQSRARSASRASYRATATASASPCYAARMEPPEYSERLTWAVCCTAGAIVGLSAVPLVLLLPAESTRPLMRPAGVYSGHGRGI